MPIRISEDEKAIVCFFAQESLGNITAELHRQMYTYSEKDVHFANTYINNNRAVQGELNILDVYAAWLNDYVYIGIKPGVADKNSEKINHEYYYAIRFISPDISKDAEKAGDGIYHYLPLRNIIVWPQEKAIDENPFSLIINQNLIEEYKTILKTPDKNLSNEQKQIKKDIMTNKTDFVENNYIRKPLADSELATAYIGDRIFWKIKKTSLTDGNEIKLYTFTGFVSGAILSNLKLIGKTNFSTLYFRHQVLSAGKNGLIDEAGEGGISLKKKKETPFGLPPGAIWN